MLISESNLKKVLKQEFRKLFEATTSPVIITRGQGYTDADFGIDILGYNPATPEQRNAGILWRTSSIQRSTDLAYLMFGTFPKLNNSGAYNSLLTLFKNQQSEPTDDLINRVFMIWNNVDQYNSPQRFPYNFVDKSKGVIKNYLHHAYLLNNANGAAAQTAAPTAAAPTAAAQTAAAPATAAPTALAAGAPNYTINRGDTVATIIQKNYGFDPRKWLTLTPQEKSALMKIFATSDLNAIKAGAKVVLPPTLSLANVQYPLIANQSATAGAVAAR